MTRRNSPSLTQALVRRKRGRILRLAARHGASHVRLFGSVVRGQDNARSDVDFLVVMGKNRSLFDLINLSHDLEDLLGRKVDVVTERGLSPYLRHNIEREARPL